MKANIRKILYAMLLGVVVYFGFALYSGFGKIRDSLAIFHFETFVFACGLAFGNYVLRFLKWEFYLARLDIRGVPKLDSFLTFLSGFVLTVTPGKVGEVFKSLVLFETHGVPMTKTAPIVVAERATDVIGIVVLIVFGSLGFSGGLIWAGVGTGLVLALIITVGNKKLSMALIHLVGRMPGRVPIVTLAVALAGLGGSACSSIGGSAIRTGPVQLPEYTGPVAVYSTGQAPPGAVDLGLVEVHASQQEATVVTLLPQFVHKVAQIGGNVAVLDGIRARFELVGRAHVETFYYTCGMGATCAGTRMYAVNDEVMLVSVFGRAFSTQVVPPGEPPLIPQAPAPGESPPATSPPVSPEPTRAPETKPLEGT